MPPKDSTAIAGLVLGVLLILVDLGLFAWLLRDRKSRPRSMSDDDVAHFSRQDLRRSVVLVVLLVLSAMLIWGSRLPNLIEGKPNSLFVQVWAAAIGLICLLLLIAFVDWVATRFYAKRRRLELLEEGIELINEQKRVRKQHASGDGGSNGHGDANGVPRE